MSKIIGIGNALVDVLVQLKDENTLVQLGLPKGGMQLIDDDRQLQIAQLMDSLHPAKSTGGSAGNAMLALANLGAESGFIGRVSDDEMGLFFRANCQERGIDARLIQADGMSGVANTFITRDGERTFATHLGVAAGLSAQDITPELFQGYDLLHIEGYLVQNHELMEKVCQTARQMGLRTSIDLASWNVVQADLAFFRHLVQDYIDIVFANEEESAAFTSGKAPSEALEEIASMCEVAVVKLGGKGASAMRAGEKVVIPARKIDVVDTTAAGDFFAGGFLYALTRGASLEQCLLTGAHLSENVIQVVGTRLQDSQWTDIREYVASILN